jgi:hypothetical protein
MMNGDLRQSSGSTINNSDNTVMSAGTGTAESANAMDACAQPGPETIQVEQVLGADTQQKVVDFDMTVPDPKPDIEQIIDVYVKGVGINSVNVITDKVVVRGELAVKVMYVADLPSQPVHAFEQSQIRFTRDIPIEGATRNMNANADVSVEYIDFDFDPNIDNRKVHITIVLKFWARVMTTTQMDVYALTPVDEMGQPEYPTAMTSSGENMSATVAGGYLSANQMGQVEAPPTPSAPPMPPAPMPAPPNVQVSTMGVSPTAGPVAGPPPGTVAVTGTSVNIRTGPGTNFPVVTQVNTGDVLTIKDQAFGWYKVVLPDGNTTGWVASWLVSAGTAPSKG